MLPSSRAEDVSNFNSYDEARLALEQVVAYKTTLADLKELGFDVQLSGNVEQIAYPQWVGVLVHPNIPLDRAEPGIRDCLAAEKNCSAYVFRFSRLTNERTGNFALDYLNFRRTVHSHGWRFEGMMLVRGDLVLFRNHGGRPNIELVEDRKNPLGPFQTLGESSASRLLP